MLSGTQLAVAGTAKAAGAGASQSPPAKQDGQPRTGGPAVRLVEQVLSILSMSL